MTTDAEIELLDDKGHAIADTRRPCRIHNPSGKWVLAEPVQYKNLPLGLTVVGARFHALTAVNPLSFDPIATGQSDEATYNEITIKP